MAEKAEQMKAGQYEIVQPNTVFRQTTSKPNEPHTWVEHRTGAVIELSAEEAERLKDIIGKPGEAARREAERLRGEAERAQQAADAAEERAKAASAEAKSSGSAKQ